MILIRAAEQRIRARGLHRAELAVEQRNPRARALYERPGYIACGCEPASWARTTLPLVRERLGPVGLGRC
jgi:ribosomal protein S18 acetylase RimI-like enzyme